MLSATHPHDVTRHSFFRSRSSLKDDSSGITLTAVVRTPQTLAGTSAAYTSRTLKRTMATKQALIVGAGAIGLRTAVELLRRQVKVVLRAPLPPTHASVCSVGAGGLWMPFHCDDPRVDRWSMETLDELLPIAERKDDLVEIVPAVTLLRKHSGPQVDDFAKNTYTSQSGGKTISAALPPWTQDSRIFFQHMTVEMLTWQNIVHKMRIPSEQVLKEAGYLHAWFFRPPIVNSPAMLNSLLEEVRESDADVNVETVHTYSSLEEMRADAESLGCDTVINCTGLGSRQLLGDKQLVGARGILLQFDREKCVRNASVLETATGEATTQDAIIAVEEEPWGTETHPAYLIARGDKIVVGGTYLEGDTETTIRDQERARLYRNANLLGIDVEKSAVVGEWVGFRPYRPTVRCEYDTNYNRDCDGVKVFHNYGHGGSGWTVNVGAAKECATLLLQ